MRAFRVGRPERQPRGIGNNVVNKAAYGQNTASGAYGRGAHSYQEATFDGMPAFKRFRAGQLEFFYGEDIHREGFLTDHVGHGHAIIKNGKLIYRCRPGASDPDIDIKE
jgi:hypothetical protein